MSEMMDEKALETLMNLVTCLEEHGEGVDRVDLELSDHEHLQMVRIVNAVSRAIVDRICDNDEVLDALYFKKVAEKSDDLLRAIWS
jgi:hypothetical protein